MKKIKPLKDLSLDELQQRKKMMLGVVIGLGSVILIAGIFVLYVAITTKKPGLIAVAVCGPISFLSNFINLQKINSEIKKRN